MERVTIAIGDMFAGDHGDFFQVVKTTEKTVTVRPVKSACTGRDGWESHHTPVKDEFTRCFHWDRTANERGKRCTVNWWHGPKMPSIKISAGIEAIYWDGKPTTWDHYN